MNKQTENIEKEPRELAFMIAKAAEEKKAIDTEILDVSNLTNLTEYLVITSGETAPQLKAIANHVDDVLSSAGIEPSHREGKTGHKWFLFDYGNVIVHILDPETRMFYNIEEFWNQADFIPSDEWN